MFLLNVLPWMLHGNANLVLPVSTNQPTKKQKKMADNV